jgi:hypothetical protein
MDQGESVDHSGDAHSPLPGRETEAAPVPVSGKPGIQNPGSCHDHRGLAAAEPGADHERGGEDFRQPYQQQPEQKIGQQHPGRDGRHALS